MITSKDYATNYVLRQLGDETSYLEQYVSDMSLKEYQEFNSYQEFVDYFKSYLDAFSYKDKETIRYYTGIAFRDINAVSRNNWNYDNNGGNAERLNESKRLAFDLDKIISKGMPLADDIVCYRGANISAFKRFGINDLKELVNLKDQYIYENGFTSTSVVKDKCFFDRDLEYHSDCNILVKFLIPAGNTDGVALASDEVSYTPMQTEYLLNKGSLSKVIDVKILDNKAYITMVYIPKKIWNKTRENENKTKR